MKRQHSDLGDESVDKKEAVPPSSATSPAPTTTSPPPFFTMLPYQVLSKCGIYCRMGRNKHTPDSDPVTLCRHAENGVGIASYNRPDAKEPAPLHCRGRPIELCPFDQARVAGVCIECEHCIFLYGACEESCAPLPVTLKDLFPKVQFTADQLARENQFFLCRACRIKHKMNVLTTGSAIAHLLHKVELKATEFQTPTITAEFVSAQLVSRFQSDLASASKVAMDAEATDVMMKNMELWIGALGKLSYSQLARMLDLAEKRPKFSANACSYQVMFSWNHFILSFK